MTKRLQLEMRLADYDDKGIPATFVAKGGIDIDAETLKNQGPAPYKIIGQLSLASLLTDGQLVLNQTSLDPPGDCTRNPTSDQLRQLANLIDQKQMKVSLRTWDAGRFKTIQFVLEKPA